MSTGALSLSFQQNQAYIENLKKESKKEKVFTSQILRKYTYKLPNRHLLVQN